MNEENEVKKDINIKDSLHTLEGDLLASMKNENYESNIVKIVSHDDKKESGVGKIISHDVDYEKEPRSFKLSATIVYIGVTVLFLLIIAGGSYYFIETYTRATVPTTSTVATTTKTPPITPSINIFESEVILPIKITTFNKTQLIERINQAKQELLNKKVKNRTNISLTTDVGLADFFNKLQYSGPESLIRSFPADKPYGFGLYHIQNTDFETYFIAKIDIFDLAFSGMLEWENSIPIDFEKIYTYKPVATVGTSTVVNEPRFTDKVIKNIDTRIYTDPNKGIKIVYGIVNKQYLLITSGENSFIDIINRLLINNVLR